MPIFAIDNELIMEELLMSTKPEVKDENMKVDNQNVESSTQQPMPSIWYT